MVVPARPRADVSLTMRTLMQQTLQDIEVHLVVDHAGKGANWARNRGAELARGTYLLLSDDDIEWHPEALEWMATCLDESSTDIGFVYGAYKMGEKVQCNVEFSAAALKRENYISTMSLMKREAFPGMDENVERLQDWDLWLTLLRKGYLGRYVGRQVFTTPVKDGITFGENAPDWHKANQYIREKHGLL